MTALTMFIAALGSGPQNKLAESIGISTPYMNDILHGRRLLTVRVLRQIPNGKAIYLAQAIEEAERKWLRAVEGNGFSEYEP